MPPDVHSFRWPAMRTSERWVEFTNPGADIGGFVDERAEHVEHDGIDLQL
jgi:hypothetical protein